MSELPKGWERVPLGKYIKLKNGFAFKSKDFVNKADNTYPVIRISDIQNGKVSTEENAHVLEDIANFKFTIDKGDLLIAMSGATTGKTGVYIGQEVALQNQRVGNLKLVNSTTSCPRYRNYLIASLKQEIIKKAYGAAQPNISAKELESIEVNIAPFEEQKRIADKLDSVLAKVEAAQARLDKIPAILKRFRQSVLAAATSGELTKEWRELNRVEPSYKENIDWTVLDGGTAPHNIPLSWTWHHVGELIEIHNSKRKPLKQADRDKRSGEYPYYGAFGVIDDIDDFLFDGRYLLLAEDGKNLESRQRPISLIATGKFWVNNHAHVIQGKNNVTIEYLMHFFNSPTIEIDQFLTGMDQVKLNKSSMIKIPIPLPPHIEQKEINRRVEELFSSAFIVEKQYQAAKKRLDKLTQSILAKAFKGELLPSSVNSHIEAIENSIEALNA